MFSSKFLKNILDTNCAKNDRFGTLRRSNFVGKDKEDVPKAEDLEYRVTVLELRMDAVVDRVDRYEQ